MGTEQPVNIITAVWAGRLLAHDGARLGPSLFASV